MSNFIWLDKTLYPQYCDNTRGDIFSINKDAFCMAEFTRTYELSSSAVLRVCADTRYELYINGRLIGRGPASPGADFLTEKMTYCYYDEYEIIDTPSVEIRIVVTSSATAISEYSFGHPGVYAELISDGITVGVTDKSWGARYLSERCGVYYTDYTLPPHPITAPMIIPDIHNMLRSPLKHLAEETVFPKEEQKITLGGYEKAQKIFTFDKIYSAFPVISIRANDKVRVIFESAEIDGIGSITEELVTNRDTVHICQRMRSIGYINVTVENLSDKSATLDGLYILYSHYPIENETGLKTSNELINRIYDVCMHTLKICRQSIHLDSPTHQEPIACTGDYYIQAKMEYMNIYDPSLTAFDIFRTSEILKLQGGRMFHTSYSLMFTMWLYDYYMHTADKELVFKSREAILALLSLFDTYVAKDNGLIEYAPDYMFVDWIVMKDAPDPYGDARDVMSHGRNEGFSLHHPPKVLGQSVLCMLYYRSLVCSAKLFSLMNDEKSAEECLDKAEKIKFSINKYLYDSKRGLYIGGLNTPDRVPIGGWLPENIDRTFYLKQANVLAVLYGIAPGCERERILDYVAGDLRKEEMQPYFYSFLLEAICNEGLFGKYGISLIERYRSLIERCDKGLCEAWEYINCDCSHAWGGAPAYILKRALSGFEMIEAGYKRIRLEPKLYSLDSAELGIPTPYGPIEIRMAKDSYDIKAPKEIEIVFDKTKKPF